MKESDKKLYEKLWASAQQLRANSSLKLNEISEPILGLIFLKFAEVKFEQARKEISKDGCLIIGDANITRERPLNPSDFKERGVLFVPDLATFNYLMNLAEKENRILITNDKDFGELVFRFKMRAPGIILLRLKNDLIVKAVKDKPLFSKYKDLLPDFNDIPCEVVGWCRYKELEEVSSIPGQAFDNGTRFVKKSGELHKSKSDWKKLIQQL